MLPKTSLEVVLGRLDRLMHHSHLIDIRGKYRIARAQRGRPLAEGDGERLISNRWELGPRLKIAGSF